MNIHSVLSIFYHKTISCCIQLNCFRWINEPRCTWWEVLSLNIARDQQSCDCAKGNQHRSLVPILKKYSENRLHRCSHEQSISTHLLCGKRPASHLQATRTRLRGRWDWRGRRDGARCGQKELPPNPPAETVWSTSGQKPEAVSSYRALSPKSLPSFSLKPWIAGGVHQLLAG
jgi:hypothetical protein